MRAFVVGVLCVHGLIHLLGTAKAFGLAVLPHLTQPISRPWGVAWLVAAALVLASAFMFGAGARRAWLVGALALVLSQTVIILSWRDAWAGTTANLVLLIAVTHGWLTEGPLSFHAQFLRDASAGFARVTAAPAVSDADLAHLPEPVQRYLRVSGVVGQPRVRSYALRFRGRIRSAPDARWMPFEAEQVSFADPPTRLFLMRAQLFGIPVEAFHRSVAGHATMQVTVAGAIPLVHAHGPVMDQSENVTVFNDMCLLAPGTLLDRGIVWTAVDARTASAQFTNGGHTISATLRFGEHGFLTDFVSDDRSRSSPDGNAFTRLRFSTPVRDYRAFGTAVLAGHGDARWHLPEGAFTYGEFDLLDVAYNRAR